MFRKIGVMTLGIAFIVTGLIFLFHQFMDYPIVRILRIAWPGIFIVFGIECIVSYTLASKRNDEQSLKISYGSIFVILMLCTFIGLIGCNLIHFDLDNGLEVNRTYRVVVESMQY
ncbi:MAG: hypothetical protein MJA31_19500 [Clostridia bacterium]|nr:hypothetical protein [Clostridia bacterium]